MDSYAITLDLVPSAFTQVDEGIHFITLKSAILWPITDADRRNIRRNHPHGEYEIQADRCDLRVEDDHLLWVIQKDWLLKFDGTPADAIAYLVETADQFITNASWADIDFDMGVY